MFEDLDDYYEYLCYFCKDDEQPMSGGVFLQGEGYLHMAFPTFDNRSYLSVFAHELTHACLSHLPLPLWVNEALAMRMENFVCGTSTFEMDPEILARHREQWNPQTIQQFWAGSSWEIPGDSFGLSYSLAQVLWRKIEVDLRSRSDLLLEFVGASDCLDGGESACQKAFGVGLGDLVADFLGEGDWAPKPEKWGKTSGEGPS